MRHIYQGERVKDSKIIKGNYFYDAYKNKAYIFPEKIDYVLKFNPDIYEVSNKSVGISLEIFDAKGEVLYNNDKVIVNIKDRLTEKVEIIQADIRFNEKYLIFYIHPVSDEYGAILFKGDSKYDVLSIEKISSFTNI